MSNWSEILKTAITVALFVGGLVTGYVHLVLKAAKDEMKADLVQVKSDIKEDLGKVKDAILDTVKQEFQLSNIAAIKEVEFRRRLRLLERKAGLNNDDDDT